MVDVRQTGSGPFTGLRQGELFALRRRDVDMMHGSVSVHRKRIRLASGEMIEDEPKSEAGRRKVAMPAPLITELQRHLTAYTGSDADAYVFTSSTGEPIDACNFRSRVWLPAARACDLGGLRFHDLRHTAGTLAARTGATTKEIMSPPRLGHSSPRASMMYQHAAEDRDRLIAERLAAMATEAGLGAVLPFRRKAEQPGDATLPATHSDDGEAGLGESGRP